MVNNCKRYYYTSDSIGLKLKSNSDQWYSTIEFLDNKDLSLVEEITVV
jgi:hypothetical protein